LSDFNDPYENVSNINFHDSLGTCIPNLKDLGKVCCFSQSHDNYLLWSHYSNSHKGFCIEYSFDDIDIEKKKHEMKINGHNCVIGKISYRNKPLVCKKMPTLKYSKELCKIFFQKYPMWKYEKEVRMVLFTNKPCSISIPGCRISKVIFGNRTDKSVITRIFLQIAFYQLPIEIFFVDYNHAINKMITFQRTTDWFFGKEV
jgi:hypothetical protein